MCVFVFTENPYYKLLTNATILTPLASSPQISIIVAIDSDGTKKQQSVVSNSLMLASRDDGTFVKKFVQDSGNFQLYHYLFSPLRRSNMGQYIIYSGINISDHTIHILISCILLEINNTRRLNISIEVTITTEGDIMCCV